MRFDVYGRFRGEGRREGDARRAYRTEGGKRVPLPDVVLPAEMTDDGVAVYLDDVFHKHARHWDTVTRLPD